MTLPYERTRAVTFTEKFLKDLCNPSETPDVPAEIRTRAKHLLRHYPNLHDIKVACHLKSDGIIENPFGIENN